MKTDKRFYRSLAYAAIGHVLLLGTGVFWLQESRRFTPPVKIIDISLVELPDGPVSAQPAVAVPPAAGTRTKISPRIPDKAPAESGGKKKNEPASAPPTPRNAISSTVGRVDQNNASPDPDRVNLQEKLNLLQEKKAREQSLVGGTVGNTVEELQKNLANKRSSGTDAGTTSSAKQTGKSIIAGNGNSGNGNQGGNGSGSGVSGSDRGGGGPGKGTIISKAMILNYQVQIASIIQRNWSFANSRLKNRLRGFGMEVYVRIYVRSDGIITQTIYGKTSSSASLNNSVKKALEKSSPLPPPPKEEWFSFVFTPEGIEP